METLCESLPGGGRRDLETFLVEWKLRTTPPPTTPAIRLETFLVEWKPVIEEGLGGAFEPLKPS